MFKKLSSAIGSLTVSRESSPPPGPDHYNSSRIKQYNKLASDLAAAGVPVSSTSALDDCGTCDHAADCDGDHDHPTAGSGAGAGTIVEVGQPWNGKPYSEYVQETYGDLGGLPPSVETDWETDLAGSSEGGRGRVVVISTGKSDWERDHYVSCAVCLFCRDICVGTHSWSSNQMKHKQQLMVRTTNHYSRIIYTT
jgi:hypothetical protein